MLKMTANAELPDDGLLGIMSRFPSESTAKSNSSKYCAHSSNQATGEQDENDFRVREPPSRRKCRNVVQERQTDAEYVSAVEPITAEEETRTSGYGVHLHAGSVRISSQCHGTDA